MKRRLTEVFALSWTVFTTQLWLQADLHSFAQLSVLLTSLVLASPFELELPRHQSKPRY
jgi:hypothetical protein